MPYRLALVFAALAIAGCTTKLASPTNTALQTTPLTATDIPRDVGAILAPIVSQNKIPGLAAVVLRGDTIVAQGVAGVRKLGSSAPITINDRFLLCSAGKAMTATLVAMAVEEGRLSWNTTLGEIFADTFEDMHPAWKAVTVAQLLEHRAGVPTDNALLWSVVRLNFSHDSVEKKRQEIIAKVLRKRPPYAPGSRYVYASIDYIIVGALLEKITGQSWEDLIRKRLWQPLGITSGGFGVPGTPGKIDQPWSHWGMLVTGHPAGPGSLWANLSAPLFAEPAGIGHMTVADWANFIALHLRGDPANPHHTANLLAANSFATLHRVEPGSFYESGWILMQRPWANGHRTGDTGRVISSQGDNGFWHCEAWVAPEIDFAVLIVCNQGGPAADKPANVACQEALSSLLQKFGP